MVNILILVILVNLGSGDSSESDDSKKSDYSSKNCDSGESFYYGVSGEYDSGEFSDFGEYSEYGEYCDICKSDSSWESVAFGETGNSDDAGCLWIW